MHYCKDILFLLSSQFTISCNFYILTLKFTKINHILMAIIKEQGILASICSGDNTAQQIQILKSAR